MRNTGDVGRQGEPLAGRHSAFPSRFAPALARVRALAHDDRYLGALIFGSVARGGWTDRSDLDVMVVTDEDNPCRNINHPIIGGVKLDLTFSSLTQIRQTTAETISQGARQPMIAGAVGLFDKTGGLAALLAEANAARPRPIAPDEHQLIQFLFFHMDDKIARYLDRDPLTALVSMHMNLGEALEWHYRLRGQWRVSSKWLLADLRRWDAPMADLVAQFISTADPHPKFALWGAIIDRALAPLGGRQPIAENNCACAECARDLAALCQD